MYECNICGYKTEFSSNFSSHKKTKKHLLKLELKNQTSDTNNNICSSNVANVTETGTIKLQKSIVKSIVYKCEKCDLDFKHHSSYYRHKKNCKIKNSDDNQKNYETINELKLKLEFSEKEKMLVEREKEIIKKIEEEKSAMLKEKTEFINNFMASANTLLNKANDNTKITAQAMQTVSVSALKYANDKFKNAPALLPLENFSINNLSFDNENDRKQLTEILIYNAKQKSLDKLLGDHIIKEYKKENPEEQSFHTTDCSRLNYIVRDLIENALIWSMDKSGIKICTSIVKPLIEKCINLLLEHQKDLIEEMSSGDYYNKETVKTIISVLMSIDRGSLESDIIKYIAPFFNLNKNS